MSRMNCISPNQIAFELSFQEFAPAPLTLAVSNAVVPEKDSKVLAKEAKDRLKQAMKLRSLGEDLISKAEISSGQTRLTNTRRRAAMASSAEQTAAEARALGRTMINLAAAIESGEAKHLLGVSSKAAVEALIKELRCVETYARQAGKVLDHEAIGTFARIHGPQWGLSGSSWERAVALTEGLDGAEQFHALIKGGESITPQALQLMTELLGKAQTEYELGWYNVSRVAHVGRLKRAGIETDEQLKGALQEFLVFKAERQAGCPVKAAIRNLVGRSVGIDFFPTPDSVCRRMVDIACIKPGMRVVEPSAGCGNIADAAKAAGAEVDVIEISDELRAILQLKGFSVIGADFDEMDGVPRTLRRCCADESALWQAQRRAPYPQSL